MARIEVDDRLAERIVAAIEDFDSIAGELRRMNKRISRIEGRGEQSGVDLAALTAKVEAETTIDQSIKTLLEGLVEIDPALADLIAKLAPSTDKLLEAVRANTSV